MAGTRASTVTASIHHGRCRGAAVVAVGVALAVLAAGCGTGTPQRDVADVVRAQVAPAAATEADSAAGARAVDRFTAETAGPIMAAQTGNVAYSPVSIAVALGMLRAGVTGQSARQLDRLFGLPGHELPAAMNGLDRTVAGLSERIDRGHGHRATIAVDAANALWGQRGVNWRTPFLHTLARSYGTGMHVVDYAGDHDGARRTVNDWVSHRTHGKIDDLITPTTFTPDTRLALTNALYLTAPWATEFTSIGNRSFTSAAGTTDVPMMSADLHATYHRGPGWQSVSIPYLGGRLAMTLVVPVGPGLRTVRQQLSAGTLLPAATATSVSRPVRLTMPLFDLSSQVDLTHALRQAGLTAPFNPGTDDLRPMSHDPKAGDLHVAAVLHRATVTVDEHGTEAAAATAVGVTSTSASAQPPVQLQVDRPFLFVLHDTSTGTPLFIGRVTDPAQR